MKLRAYIESVVDEMLNKVTWPTWAELQSSAFIVLISSVIVALTVWLMDFTFGINAGFFKGVLGYIYELIG